MKDFLKEAREYADRGEIEAWVHSFLVLEEKNKGLSEGLKKQKRFWVGPVEVELSRLPRIVGPEAHMEYLVDATGWEMKRKRMALDIANDWHPAPLIAEYRDGTLSLRDGNHRREALELAGLDKYWTIIWFNSEEDFKRYNNL